MARHLHGHSCMVLHPSNRHRHFTSPKQRPQHSFLPCFFLTYTHTHTHTNTGTHKPMSSPKQQIHSAFGATKTLYEILGVAKDATASAIRKGYFKMALTCHPDKCQDDPEATARFQALSIIHATLSDEEKRRNYDETGEIEEQDADLNQSEKEWYDYWRAMFPAVTVEKIQQFQGEYKGSEEEKGDVLRIYEECEGKMTEVIDNVMLASDEDEARFREMIEAAIARKEVKRFKAFKAQVKDNEKRKKKAEKEAKEAEELMRAIQAKRGPDALAHMAEDRKRQMSSFLDSLEEKYTSNDGKKGGGGGGGGGSGKGKKKAKKQSEPDDIDDEEFEKLRASITKKGKGRE